MYIKGLNKLCVIDLGVIGTWIGALGTTGTGIMLWRVACKQNEINQRAQKIELALRYQDHSKKL